jgi:bifunctional DNA-binding transcriptional regulator/antitoxin component of YhaV-PrlF toxin-antitoxin module
MGFKVKAPRRNRMRLSSKNQVTIPVVVLREMGVRPGDELEIVPRGREAVIRSATKSPWLKRAGSLTGVWPPDHLESLRDEWDRSQPIADLDRTS